MQDNARITKPSWLMFFSHRDQQTCKVDPEKNKLKVILDTDGIIPHSCCRGLKIYPALSNSKRNKPLGIAKRKYTENTQTKIDQTLGSSWGYTRNLEPFSSSLKSQRFLQTSS